MKKLFAVLAAIVSLVVLSTAHGTVSAAADKQLICHVSGTTGKIIEVATAAVPKHLANHGDCLINSANRDLIGQSCDATDANGNDICDIQP